MSIQGHVRKRVWLAAVIALTAVAAGGPEAQGTGQSFLFLQAGFTQDLFAVSDPLPVPNILGGVAFAPNGDVWSTDCQFWETTLRRFERGTTTGHPLIGTIDLTASGPYQTLFPAGIGGCGLVNHPDGFMYMNAAAGVWRLDANSGRPINPTTGLPIQSTDPDTGGAAPLGQPGNALGIAVDPVADASGHHHLVYVGADCHPSLIPAATTCTLYDLDPATGASKVFARFNHNLTPDGPVNSDFLDGLYFSPSGQHLFGAYRAIDPITNTRNNGLAIIRRPDALMALNVLPDDAQRVRFVPTASEPDGVAFHASGGFVVTLDESRTDSNDCVRPDSQIVPRDTNSNACPAGSVGFPSGGTLTRIDFAGGNFESGAVTQSVLGAGGFRGDLLQVGADGCIYGTQGALFESGGTSGVRYDDGSTNPPELNINSIVQICGGFAFAPGVGGKIGDFVWQDTNGNGIQDAGEPGIPNVTVRLRPYHGAADLMTTTTDSTGHYKFVELPLGDYTVVVDAPAGLGPTPSLAHAPAATDLDSNGSPADITLTIDSTVRSDVDFGYSQQAQAASVRLVKKTNGTDNDAAPGLYLPVGSMVTWTYEVTNTGNASLTNVSVTDDKVTGISCPGTTLAANASMTCTATGTAVAGQHTNIGTVTGTPPTGASVTASNPDNYFGSSPAITLVKKTNGTDNNATPGPYLVVGTGVVWTYFVQNPGNVALTNVAVTDNRVSGISCPQTTLAAGASMTCTAAGTAIAGQYTNIGTATGTPPVGSNVTAHDLENYYGVNPLTLSCPATTGQVGVLYNSALLASGGLTPYVYSIMSGAIPTGLSLNPSTGAITGTPTAAGSFSVTAKVVDARNNATGTKTSSCNVTIQPALVGSIGDFVWLDSNGNGLQDSGEPGLGGIAVTLKQGSTVVATTTTNSNGGYLFSNLALGTYTVSVATPSGLVTSAAGVGADRTTDSSDSPVTVTLTIAAPRDLTVDFGFKDTTAPTCPFVIESGPPTKVTFTVMDLNGISKIQITQISNFSVVVTPPGGAATTTTTTKTLSPAASPVTLVASRINASQSASLTFSATDPYGNVTSCDPTIMTVGTVGPVGKGHPGFRHHLGKKGRNEIAVVEKVPAAKHYITIQNNTPGLRQILIVVNDRRYQLLSVMDGQVINLDVSAAMKPGNKNRIIIAGRGPDPAGTAVVTINDVPF